MHFHKNHIKGLTAEMTTLFRLSAFILLYLQCKSSTMPNSNMVSIRGHVQSQALPMAMTKQWPVFTYENNELLRVESELDADPDDSNIPAGWVRFGIICAFIYSCYESLQQYIQSKIKCRTAGQSFKL